MPPDDRWRQLSGISVGLRQCSRHEVPWPVAFPHANGNSGVRCSKVRINATNLVDCLCCLERRRERRPVGGFNRGAPGATLVRYLLVRGLGRLVCAPNRSLRPARPGVERHPAHERQRPCPGAGARRRARALGTALAAARDSRSRKGQLRDRRRADHRRLGDHRRSLAEERCHASREAQGRGRDHPGQDDNARVRVRLDDARLRRSA